MANFLSIDDAISVGKLAHTLKGLSANLGANALSASAMQLEHAADLATEEQQNCLANFNTELNKLVNDLQSFLPSQTEKTTRIDKADFYKEHELEKKLSELSAMIQEQKMDAYDQAQILSAHWPKPEDAEHFDKLVDFLDLFEFESAQETLSEISKSLR